MGQAYNHPYGCSCNWCTGQGRKRRGTPPSTYEVDNRPTHQRGAYMLSSGEYMTLNRITGIIIRTESGDISESTLLSETKPTKCWHCGAKIFYYQNEYGSKVLFENLGKPWIKHECK